jgi:hypothetical protein
MMRLRTNVLYLPCLQTYLSNSLFPPLRDLGIEFKPALTVLAFDVLIRFFLAELHLRAKAMRAFEISQQLLDVTPLRT